MRVTFLFLCIFAFHLQAEQTYSQQTKISLEMKGASVEKILQTIEEKSNYYFLYNSKLVNVDRKTDIRANQESIATVLKRLFDSENVEYDVKGTQIILHPKGMGLEQKEAPPQQKKAITGRVTDENGTPIIGANVVEKGTTNGVITDMDGRFSLNVSLHAVLVITYIGYQPTEIKIGNQQSLSIILREDTEVLEEVVVVGYGSQLKKTVTGAISSVKAKDLEAPNAVSADNLLQGKVAGLIISQNSAQPGSSMSVNIRGRLSPNGSNSPLYVIT